LLTLASLEEARKLLGETLRPLRLASGCPGGGSGCPGGGSGSGSGGEAAVIVRAELLRVVEPAWLLAVT
jgi:hypothetical protein